MKYLLRIARGLLGLLVLIALVAAVAFTFGELRGAEPISQISQPPVETPAQPMYQPSATSQVTPMVAPRCTFAVPSASEVLGPSLDAYAFSAPQVVLTHTSAIGIAGWLPDGERLLITRDIPGTNRQTIETFNLHTSEVRVYAEREGANGKPVWLSGLKAVAYSTSAGQQHELWISWGDPTQAKQIAQSVEGLSLAVDPAGQRLLYFSSPANDQPQLWDAATQAVQAMPLNLAQWTWQKYEAGQPTLALPVFQTAWSPNGSQIVFYAYPEWLFLVDPKTGYLCEVDLGQVRWEPRWVFYARWSPDGRCLAMITTAGGAPIRFNELTVLDTITGESYSFNLGLPYLYDIAWSSNSETLAVLGQVNVVNGRTLMGLYLVDISSGDFRQMLPKHTFGGGAVEGWELAWSPDGHTLAVKCPVWPETESIVVEDRVCLISSGLQP